MKRTIIICVALAMVSGASANGLVKGVGKLGGALFKCASIGLVDGSIKTAVSTATDKQMKRINASTVHPSLRSQSLIELQTIIKNMELEPKQEPLEQIQCYSFGDKSTTLTFQFFDDGTAICQVPDGTSWKLTRWTVQEGAKPGWFAFKGQTVLGKGVYIFGKDHSALIFCSASDPAQQPKIYKRK